MRLRLAILVACVMVVALGWWWSVRPLQVVTEHYVIRSTALPAQTEDAGRVAEYVYAAYGRLMKGMGWTPREHGRLQMFLYGSRDEFRRSNGIEGWAEAIYREPVCHQYFAAGTPNPFHWMVHEATHQLSREVAGLTLPQWLDEGLAGCFGTSRLEAGTLKFGEVDSNTYPAWWATLLAKSGDLERDKREGSVIPLRVIVSGSGGPRLDASVNLSYLHWWSLVRFLLEDHPDGFARLVHTKGDVPAFERCIGPIEEIEADWYRSVARLKERIAAAKTPPVRL